MEGDIDCLTVAICQAKHKRGSGARLTVAGPNAANFQPVQSCARHRDSVKKWSLRLNKEPPQVSRHGLGITAGRLLDLGGKRSSILRCVLD